MSIAHHLDDATLMSLAAGTLTPALAVVAASHVALCPHCRHGLAALEAVGAALLADLSPIPLSARAAADAASTRRSRRRRTSSRHRPGDLPPPLARLVGRPLDAVRWRPLGFGIWHHRIALPAPTAASCTSFAPRPVTACRRTATTAPS